MKYVFEKYEIGERGRIFLGYISVNAGDVDEAKDIAQAKAGNNITLAQIYFAQEA